LFLAGSLLTQTEERLPLESLLSTREFRLFNAKDKYHDRIKILNKAFDGKVRFLRRCVERREIADSFRTLAELRGLAFHALQASLAEKNRKEQRHKEVKKFEIRLRKFGEEVDDLKLGVPLENRSQFEMTKELAEKLRNQLLKQLFGQVIAASGAGGLQFRLQFTSARGTPLAQGIGGRDRFTEEEFTKIQIAQELVKRVEVFLEIAESRLDEIERRVGGAEWDKEEPNPLEFYTYEDMLKAYTRALEGIMVNIDEKAESRRASEEVIRESLEKLGKKMETFTPRLEGLKPLVIEQKSEPLAERLLDAMETSAIAREGAQQGLAAMK
jgi:hypothetical protein